MHCISVSVCIWFVCWLLLHLEGLNKETNICYLRIEFILFLVSFCCCCDYFVLLLLLVLGRIIAIEIAFWSDVYSQKSANRCNHTHVRLELVSSTHTYTLLDTHQCSSMHSLSHKITLWSSSVSAIINPQLTKLVLSTQKQNTNFIE